MAHNLKTEADLKCDITEIPDRLWDSLIYIIEDQIIGLEAQATASVAMNHGAMAHVMGSINQLRYLIVILEGCREKKE